MAPAAHSSSKNRATCEAWSRSFFDTRPFSTITPASRVAARPRTMIVGIDLGTTNSLVGFWRNGSITLVPNALGHLLTPSAVGLSDGGDILVGLPARERLTTHPTLTAAAFKRYMGTERLMF